MCGIAGFIEKKPNKISNKKQTLLEMTDAINHRGPDDYAEFISDKYAIGMRRLAIMDLTPGLYPFSSSDGNQKLIFNGEIYNYLDIKKELVLLGHSFNSNCDGEVILKGYLQWGIDVFKKLQGMFAVCIVDMAKDSMILARDRIGIKPIYYIDSPDFLLFSSEVKSFAKFEQAKQIDYENVELLLGFMFLPKSDETLLKNVKKLEPATILEINSKGNKFTKYWDITDAPNLDNISFADAVDQLDSLLVETIRMHLMADVPLGVLLSGGLDSGLLTAIMAKKGLGNDIKTFTAKFNHKFNESELAFKTAHDFGTTHTEFLIDTEEINKNIESYIDTFDDLTSLDGGTITTKILSKKVEETGIKVLLLGEGSDEIFGGYSWFGLSKMPLNFVPKFARDSLYYYAISRNINFRFFDHAKYWSNLTKNASIFKEISAREVKFQLPNHLLMKVDKGTMAASIEARVPYLDHKLVEFVYGLPDNYKISGKFVSLKSANEKYILREVAKRYLPSDVVTRKKRGFFLPMNDVLTGNYDKVKNYVYAKDSITSKLLSVAQRDQLFNQNVPNVIKMQNEYMLWRLFLLEVWASKNKLK